MKFLNPLKFALGAMVALAMLVAFTGCSSDDSSPTGSSPNTTPGLTYDEITVSLTSLYVKYDCDYNPVGVTQPGDFHYRMRVDTLSDDGTAWIVASDNKEVGSDVNNGGTVNISGQQASFRFPRREGQAFRVRLSLREVDAGGNDFSSSLSVAHVYSAASTQMYAPEGTNYSSWDNATKVGKMSWNVNKRDRSYVLGVLTVEGCNATLNYSVSVRPVS